MGARDVPDVVDDHCTLWDPVSHVRVILERSMRYAEHNGWHPPQALLDAATDIRHVDVIVIVGQPIGPDDSVNLFPRLFLYFRPYDACEYERVEGRGRRVRTSFQERATDITSRIVGEALFFLCAVNVIAETGLQ